MLSGRIYIPSWVIDGEADDDDNPFRDNVQEETLKLTRRQNEVLTLLARGMSNKEIARELGIAEEHQQDSYCSAPTRAWRTKSSRSGGQGSPDRKIRGITRASGARCLKPRGGGLAEVKLANSLSELPQSTQRLSAMKG
ncbi:response regulator transcription factor [Bradyrhizobium sp. TZ2]